MNIVMVPGIDGSGEQHWQTLWAGDDPQIRSIAPGSWTSPELEDWMRALDDAVDSALESEAGAVLLVAHSLGCIAAVEWLGRAHPAGVAGAVLVAPPDEAIDIFPERCPSFIGIARGAVSVPLLLILSSDDPYCSPDAAAELARRWKAEPVVAGALGHINGASGLADWPVGRALVDAFAEAVLREPAPDRRRAQRQAATP
ncbi:MULTISPECIES: RBBP9/YdeN family alpha/beta hydrolase [unclassified Leifsonia]|uniref:RBBP9/YdeN family alpha/beta hydrolase n=1 Tax=unclassified Leifsonia TaxID=2663824 RepID=UPI0009EA4788|nr:MULTISPECIES: alpha/beta fold hydrolase [unclassified Leifsonia]